MARRSIPLFVATLAASALASAVACHSSGPPRGNSAGDDGQRRRRPTAASPSRPIRPPSTSRRSRTSSSACRPPTPRSRRSRATRRSSARSSTSGCSCPSTATKMLRFFELAFQQTQVTYTDFSDQAYPKQIAINSTTIPLLMQNAQESFARTMLQLIAERPAAHAGDDDDAAHDDDRDEGALRLPRRVRGRRQRQRHRRTSRTPTRTSRSRRRRPQGPIPICGDARPDEPELHALVRPGRRDGGLHASPAARPIPIVYPAERGRAPLPPLRVARRPEEPARGGTNCPPVSAAARRRRSSRRATSPTGRWSPSARRARARRRRRSTTCRRCARRTSSCSTCRASGSSARPAFFANWQTNTSNTMRVTMNQTLIVALGSMVDGTDTTTPPGTPGLDTTHADQAACYGCHKILDPSRSILVVDVVVELPRAARPDLDRAARASSPSAASSSR